MLVAYYRVSTEQQGRSGLGLEAQKETVAKYAERTNEAVVREFVEVESGRVRERPQLEAAIRYAKARRAKLTVAKLDRLARDAAFILKLVDTGIPIVFVDLPELASGDPIVGRLTLTIMASVAEFEGRRIGQRVREAMAQYKARGGKLGVHRVPKPGQRASIGFSNEQRLLGSRIAAKTNVEKAQEFRENMLPVIEEIATGRTLKQAAEELNARGFVTRRGKSWTLGTVHAILGRSPINCPQH